MPLNRTPTKTTYTHRLRSKTSKNDEVLIITSYDYFLDKVGLAYLLRHYREVILVPRTVDDDYLLNQTVRPLLEQFPKIHLIISPQYDSRYRVIYELIVKENKSIRITTVYDFCEKVLHKIYIPDSFQEKNPGIPATLTFSWGIRVTKVLVDTVISILLILLTFPIWLYSMLRIRQQSPGPVFYKQERVGLNQSTFDCIKFRSMTTDAEALGAVFSRRNDLRVYRYGSLMRATRIDELPQLLNIARGEISLVGPRPERPVFTQTFEECIPYYHMRHKVKPGITGYAQVMYAYGAGVQDARHKLMYDLYYIKNWNFSLEMKILFRTVLVILNRKGR
jgi:lipopolysaccharide/colanic/teichoic acid biosynthesis glycosyltransferase